MKKILVSMGAVAMAFAMATPAFAVNFQQLGDRGASNTLLISNTSATAVTTSQTATVNNNVSSSCNSGGNTVSAALGDVKGNTITTGNSTCGTQVTNTVNSANITVNAPTTIGSEATAPTTDQEGDRGATNGVALTSADAAVVAHSSTADVTNTQAATVDTGDNATATFLGDNENNAITTGTNAGISSLTQNLDGLVMMFNR